MTAVTVVARNANFQSKSNQPKTNIRRVFYMCTSRHIAIASELNHVDSSIFHTHTHTLTAMVLFEYLTLDIQYTHDAYTMFRRDASSRQFLQAG